MAKAPTSTWTSDDLTRIGAAEELELASRKADGELRKRVVIWVVRLDDGLYVRCVGGRSGAWFRGTQDRHQGRIWAGGVEKDVAFASPDDAVADKLDAAFRSKYRRYADSIVDHVVSPQARAATIKLSPQ